MKMNRYFLFFLIIIGVTSCQTVEKQTTTKGSLLVFVSESHQDLIQAEADLFNSLYAEANITVMGTSTREAMVHFLNDSVQAVVTDRKLNPEERKIVADAELRIGEIIIAEDALAVIVNHINPIESISEQSLRDILTNKITNWNQIPASRFSGPIVLVTTDNNSGAYELLKDYFFHGEEVKSHKIVDSQQKVLETVTRQALSIGVISLACYKNPLLQLLTGDTAASVHAMHFEGVDSLGNKELNKLHQANVYLGKYPLHYPVYFYINPAASPLAGGFSSFVASAPGQKIILNWGLVPKTMPVRLVTLTQTNE